MSCSPKKGCVALLHSRAGSTDSNIKGRKIQEPTSMGLPKPAVGPSLAASQLPWHLEGSQEQLDAPGWTWPLTDGASATEKDQEQSRGSLGSAHMAPTGSLFSISLKLSGPCWGFSLPSKPRRWRAESEDSSHLIPAFIQRGKQCENSHFFSPPMGH